MSDDAQAILAELHALRREVASVAADVSVIRDVLQGVCDRVVRLEQARLRSTPLPAGVPTPMDDRW